MVREWVRVRVRGSVRDRLWVRVSKGLGSEQLWGYGYD